MSRPFPWLLTALFLTAAPVSFATEAQPPPAPVQVVNFDNLGTHILSGQASLAEVRVCLTDMDTGRLTNTMHALYSMRWHRGVNHLLHDMWNQSTAKYPELSWDLIAEPPVKIALASTISRIQISEIGKYLDYIRSYQDSEHEFIRAQVVIALGMNGYKEDLPYIKSMANGDNPYVAQSAITGLALMNNVHGRDALVEVWLANRDDVPKRQLIEEVLKKAYDLVPRKPEEIERLKQGRQ